MIKAFIDDRRIRAGAALIAALMIAFASLKPPSGGAGLPHLDKFQHLLAYGVLSALTALSLPRVPAGPVLALILYGAFLEVLQGMMPLGREASFTDALANTVGVLAGAGLVVGGRRVRATPPP